MSLCIQAAKKLQLLSITIWKIKFVYMNLIPLAINLKIFQLFNLLTYSKSFDLVCKSTSQVCHYRTLKSQNIGKLPIYLWKYYLKIAALSLFDHLKQDYCRYRQISSMQLSLRFPLALSNQEVIRIIILLKKVPKFPVNINDWVLFQVKLWQDLVTQMKR